MIQAAIVAPDSDIRYQIEELVAPIRGIFFVRRWDRYPSTLEISKFLRATTAQLVFLSVEQMDHALTVIEHAAGLAPSVQFVAVSRHCDLQAMQKLARLGVREFLTLPASPESVGESLAPLLAGIEQQKRPETGAPVFTFLPCKPGVGASTTALQVSHCISSEPDTNVLLADFDLNNGVLGVMLGLKDPHTIVDATARASELDEIVWPKLVSTREHLDVLPAGSGDPSVSIEVTNFLYLLEYARRVYSAICVDVSGNLEEHSIAAMRESTQIVLVTGTDIASIHLARQKLHLLRRLDLKERVRVVLNESHNPGNMPVSELEGLLGMKVSQSLPSDPAGVQAAAQRGRFVSPSSPLGKRYRELASSLLDRQNKKAERKGFFRSLQPISSGVG